MTVAVILVASLVGSVHCAAMCGVIAAAAGTGARNVAAYHGSRFAGYMALGGIAGMLGAAVDGLGVWAGMTGVATRVAGAGLVLFGLAGVAAGLGVRLPFRMPAGHGLPGRIMARARAWSPARRAAVLGAVTALLPCGWLFAFVAVAGATADPLRGAVTMAVFWIGTVPAVASAGVVVARLAGPVRSRLPVLAGLVLVVVGLVTVFGRPATPASLSVGSDVVHAH